MSRQKHLYGIFRLVSNIPPRVIDGDAIETHATLCEAHERLTVHREAAKTSGGNPYLLAVLPLGKKGEGLLGPGM